MQKRIPLLLLGLLVLVQSHRSSVRQSPPVLAVIQSPPVLTVDTLDFQLLYNTPWDVSNADIAIAPDAWYQNTKDIPGHNPNPANKSVTSISYYITNTFWDIMFDSNFDIATTQGSGNPDVDFCNVMPAHHWGAIFTAEAYRKMDIDHDPRIVEVCNKIITGQLNDVAIFKFFLYKKGYFDYVDLSLPPAFPPPMWDKQSRALDTTQAQQWAESFDGVTSNLTGWLTDLKDLVSVYPPAKNFKTHKPRSFVGDATANTFYGIMMSMMDDMLNDSGYNDPHVDFLVLMITHHWGGVFMANEALRIGLAKELQSTYIGIKTSQLEQIATMKDILKSRGVEYIDPSLPPHFPSAFVPIDV